MPVETTIPRLERQRARLLAGELDLSQIPEVMKTAEVAALIDIHPGAIDYMRRCYKLPYQRLGRSILYSRASVVAWLANEVSSVDFAREKEAIALRRFQSTRRYLRDARRT